MIRNLFFVLIISVVLMGCASRNQPQLEYLPTIVTGEADWDLRNDGWCYYEDEIYYQKKLTVEMDYKTHEVEILVHLNDEAVQQDMTDSYVNESNELKGVLEFIDFLGPDPVTVRLTEQIGVAEYRGDILNVPLKKNYKRRR